MKAKQARDSGTLIPQGVYEVISGRSGQFALYVRKSTGQEHQVVAAGRAHTLSVTAFPGKPGSWGWLGGNAAQDFLVSDSHTCNYCCTQIALGGSESLKGNH